MQTDVLFTAFLLGLGALAAIGIVVSLLLNVSGTWERIPTDDEIAQWEADTQVPIPRERIVLGQLGPFVTGRREVPGGYQEFSGFMIGRTLRVNRRDHGIKALVQQGFPEAIAGLVDGDITGKYRMRLVSAGLILDGTFTPQKIEFTRRPPRVTDRHFLAPKPRRYRRLTAKELAADPLLSAQPENPVG